MTSMDVGYPEVIQPHHYEIARPGHEFHLSEYSR